MDINTFWGTVHSLGYTPTGEPHTTVTTYTIKGTTDDVTDCANGHTGLKKTVVLATLDADGNETGTIHLGCDCAARAMRTTETKVRNAAAAADHHLADARAWATHTLDTFATLTPADYLAANPRVGTETIAARLLARTINEAKKILTTGEVAGTRFAR